MRILAIILYIVVLALNAIPDNHHGNGDMVMYCESSNDITHNYEDKSDNHNNHEHGDDSGLCSPFCIDDCCSTPVVTSAPVCIASIISEYNTLENDIIINYQYSSVDTSTPPPKTT